MWRENEPKIIQGMSAHPLATNYFFNIHTLHHLDIMSMYFDALVSKDIVGWSTCFND